MLGGALAEGFGLLMIVPLATIAIRGGDSLVFRYAPWAAAWPADQRFLAALAAFVAAMALRGLLLFIRSVMVARIEAEYEADLRLRAAATLARRGWPFASTVGQAGMQSLLLNDVPRAAQGAASLQQVAIGATLLLVQLALTLWLSPLLTLVAVTFLVLGSAASLRFTRRGVRSGIAISEAMESSAGSGFRLHAGLKAALAQGTVPAFLAECRMSLAANARELTNFAQYANLAQQGAGFAAALVAATLLLVGVQVLAVPFPVLIASLILFARMAAPAQLVQNSALRAGAYASAFAAIERRLGTLEADVPAAAARQPLEWRELRLERVSYEHQAGLGLGATTLILNRGEWVGISGPSGSGKTTLLDLVAGLLPDQSGAVTVDGHRLDDARLSQWRAAISYAGQEASIFNDSVRGNLLAEGVRADDEELWRILGVVGLETRVHAFPGGLDESVGDRGSQLSGGERQRLVLARALLRRPSLLILDEATAALDAASEGALLERLKSLDPRPAALIVAHRKSTLGHCNSVLAIQHGVVTGTGTRKSR